MATKIVIKKVHRNGVKPFVKWVGGKTQLLQQLRGHYPKNFKRYFEPFLGGGAVFFDVKPKQAFLNDINTTLITAYKHVQKRTNELVDLLEQLQHTYQANSENGKSDFYYKVRGKYNQLRDGSLEKTAHLIFLNKTGFNGLYRESSSGGFNVPFGRYKTPPILDEGNLIAVANALDNAVLTSL